MTDRSPLSRTLGILIFGGLALALSLAQPAHGRRSMAYIVTTTADGGGGSLRQAILDANGSAGLDSISFNLPGSPPFTIDLGGPLPEITDPVIIDGTTQLGYSGTPIIELNATAAAFANCMTISGGGCTIRGLVINRHYYHGIQLIGAGGNLIEGNYIGTNVAGTAKLGSNAVGIQITDSPSNVVGGTSPGSRNVLRGNWHAVGIEGAASTGNVIAGNYIGIGSDGATALPGNGHGVYLSEAPSNTIGGTANGAGNVIGGGGVTGVYVLDFTTGSGNVIQGNKIGTNAAGTSAQGYGVGIYLHPGGSTVIGGSVPGARNVISGNSTGIEIGGTGNSIRGNYIGTDAGGTMALGNTLYGIVSVGSGNVIGGAGPGEGNVISGNGGHGVELNGANGATVQGNLIGTQADGITALGNSGHGVHITGSSQIVGGAAPGAANVIAFNQGDGVRIQSGSKNLVSSNSIHSNGQLGINLGTDGVTANDLGDIDTGANDLQNFPVVTSAMTNGLTTTIVGSLNSEADSTYRVEFFSSPAVDASGYGEGKTFLGAATVTTDVSGTASFSVPLPAAVSVTAFISCTATNALNNTSEFSQAIGVTQDPASPTVTLNQAGSQSDPAAAGPIHFTAVFSEAVTGFDGTDVVLSGTAGATTAAVTGGPTVYDVSVSGMVGTGTVLATIPAGAAVNGTGLPTVASASSDNSVSFDPEPPFVLNVGSTTPDGTYGKGQTIAITVAFSEAVLVTGIPTLALETGAVDAIAVYDAGSGTSSLTFTYIVSQGDSAAHLDYVSTAALSLNGSTIVDLAGNAAVLTLPAPGLAGSLGANKNLVIDTPRGGGGGTGGACGLTGMELLVVLGVLALRRR